MGRVRRVVVAAVGELADAAPRHVAQVVEATPASERRGRDPLHGVHEHAVAQRGLAEGEPLDAERRRHRLEDQGAGDDDVGPRRLEARHPGSGRRGAVAERAP